MQASIEPPSTFESALALALDVLLHANKEVSRTQTCSYFNVFLAPIRKRRRRSAAKRKPATIHPEPEPACASALALELSIPKATAEREAVGPNGKICGKYSDYAVESQLLAALVIEVFSEESQKKPLLNPKLIVRVGKESFGDEAAKALLLRAHQLAAEKGAPYFANASRKETENAVYSSTGVKLTSDLTSDWETDTLRTGCLGCVTINMPRIALECEKDKNKFFDLVRERFELAARALGIKNTALKQFGRNSLPFLLRNGNGDVYFRLENSSRMINLAGFREAVEAFTEKSVNSEEARAFAAEAIQAILTFKQKIGRKYGRRLYPALLGNSESAERLAQLDIERFGVAKVKFSGTREKPFYSNTRRFQMKMMGETLALATEQLETAQKMKGLNAGGTLEIIELEGGVYKAEALMDLTRRLIENQSLEFFTYNRIVSYCDTCKKSWFGTLHKCPCCGSMSALATFDRFAST